ncbi:MAG: hypothetical protein H6657_03500 [Ardenticatenaceae bacterium]|nr:hypothetical protein [Ardenticatenaceae bacterium]
MSEATAVPPVTMLQLEKITPCAHSKRDNTLRKLFIANTEKIIFNAKFTPMFLQNSVQNMGISTQIRHLIPTYVGERLSHRLYLGRSTPCQDVNLKNSFF